MLVDVVGPNASEKHTFIAHASGCRCVARTTARRRLDNALTYEVADKAGILSLAREEFTEHPIHLAPCCKKLL